MKKVKLPFDFKPILDTYHNLAHPLGILSGNLPDQSIWFPWLAHKYINCCYQEKSITAFDFYAKDKLFIYDKVLEVTENHISIPQWIDLYNWSVESFTAYIKDLFNKNMYLRGTYNEKYNSAMAAYQKNDFCHDYLLFGYNDEEEIFYGAGYTKNRRYEEYKIPYSEFYDCIFQSKFNYLWFRIIRLNPSAKFVTNYSVVARDLTYYLNSTAFEPPFNDNTIYGISVWDILINYLKNTEYIDIRFTKIFMEHHKLMNMRLNYFAEQGLLEHNICQQYSAAYVTANKAYLLSIKYNIKPNNTTKNECINLIRSSVETDKNVLPLVISQIDKIVHESKH